MANIDTLNTLDIEGWPSSLFPSDLGWDQLLKDIPIETDLTTNKPCKCFPLAIQIIEQLDHYEKGETAKSGDTALGIAREAVQACSHFAGCTSICHRRNGMLFIAIFQQLDAHYGGVSRRLLSTKGGTGADVEVEVEVGIGSFHVKTGLSSAIGKAIVTTEMMSAASCALRLSRMFQSDEEEVKCQRELLVSVSTSLYQCAMEFCNSTFAIHI